MKTTRHLLAFGAAILAIVAAVLWARSTAAGRSMVDEIALQAGSEPPSLGETSTAVFALG